MTDVTSDEEKPGIVSVLPTNFAKARDRLAKLLDTRDQSGSYAVYSVPELCTKLGLMRTDVESELKERCNEEAVKVFIMNGETYVMINNAETQEQMGSIERIDTADLDTPMFG